MYAWSNIWCMIFHGKYHVEREAGAFWCKKPGCKAQAQREKESKQ